MLIGYLDNNDKLVGELSAPKIITVTISDHYNASGHLSSSSTEIETEESTISCLIEEIKGTPPIIFTSSGSKLVDYCIYGADGGVGDLVDSRYLILVKIIGKNLFDKNNAEVIFAYPDMSSGQVTDGASFNAHSLVIPVTQGDYTFSMYSPTTQNVRNRFRVVCYSTYPTVGTAALSSIFEEGTVRDGDYVQLSFTAPAGTNYILVFLWSGNAYTAAVIDRVVANNELQLESGAARTDYEPYFNETVNIEVDSPLGVGDCIIKSDIGVDIPVNVGTNILTVGTTVQPIVQIKYQN